MSGVADARIPSEASSDNGGATVCSVCEHRDTSTTCTNLVKVEEGCYLLNCRVAVRRHRLQALAVVSTLQTSEFRVPGGYARSPVPGTVTPQHSLIFNVPPW